MIKKEYLNELGFNQAVCGTYKSRNYIRSCEKGSISINSKGTKLRIGGNSDGRPFIIELKNEAHLAVIMNALFNDEIDYFLGSVGGVIGGTPIKENS